MVAAEAFARAAAADPGSYTLVAWEARALRQAGQEGTALNRLATHFRSHGSGAKSLLSVLRSLRANYETPFHEPGSIQAIPCSASGWIQKLIARSLFPSCRCSAASS